MKILAVRGQNLASLASEFEIDLSRGALGGAGVFAIVGPTGAGKSTLLDAICVALFDRTPRLTNRSTVVVGRGAEDPGSLGAQDVRTILRRGAAAGYAEVDFESGDLRRYRARWSVRRARDRTDGNLQAQQITLTAIDDGERFGGTRTETLDAIHDRLGLSFDQFRRSALLAQGEFAAFLRADGRDRSELLERMTGTEIYTKLSIAAHVKAALADQQSRDGRLGLLAIPVLADDARAALADDHVRARDHARAMRERHVAIEATARWVAEGVDRIRARDAAADELAAARTAASGAGAVRDELDLRRRAERLRAPWDAAGGLARRVAQAGEELAAATRAEDAARTTQREVAAQREAAAALHAQVRAARIAVGLVERSATREPSPAARVDAELARSGVAGPRSTAEGACGASIAAGWLVARRALAPEVAAWSELDPKFAQRVEIADQIARLANAARGHEDARGRLARTREIHVADQQQAAAKLAEVRSRAAAFKAKRGVSLDDARRAEDAARLQLGDAERLVAIAAGAREAVAVCGELDRQVAEVDAATANDEVARARMIAARDAAVIVRRERHHAVDELRRVAGYDHARAELVDGDPCPLCGALEHPWHARGALDGVIREAEARLAAVATELDASVVAIAAIEARTTARGRERARLVAHHETAAASAASAAPSWQEALAATGQLAFERDPASPAAAALAAAREQAAKKQVEDARALREQVAATVKAANDAQAEIVVWQGNLELIANQLAELDRRAADLELTIERVRGERSGRVARHAELAAELEAALARWRAALPHDDRPAWIARLALEVEAPIGRTRTARFARGSLASFAADDAPGAVAVDPSDAELGLAFDRARVAMSELATAWRTRCEHVVDADAALASAVVQFEREATAVDRALAEHGARRVEAARRSGELVAEHAAAEVALATTRAAEGFAGAANDLLLASLLAAPATRIEALAEQLAAVERTIDRAAALVAERTRLVDVHATLRPPLGEDVLDAAAVVRWTIACDAAAAQVTHADQAAMRLQAELDADAVARDRRAAVEAVLADMERAAEVDRILGEVIGSHDGKLLRSFAQSLTLDGLLAVANAHLDELAPRYQLERVPTHDLELQVIDRDLGSEVRSIQSLSGGEAFLASLALALGLSSMSAHDVRVRTLLIDEGFGSLDPATLEGALSVLDRLQATGCQVGVISHVPALVERVGAHVRIHPRGGGRSDVIVA